MNKYRKRKSRRGKSHSSVLCILKIPRAWPGDTRNTIMWDNGQGHTEGGRRLEDQNNEQASIIGNLKEIQHTVKK